MRFVGQDIPAPPVLSGVKMAAAAGSFSFSRQLIITPNCLRFPGVASSADKKTEASPRGSVSATACFHVEISYWASSDELQLAVLQFFVGVPADPKPIAYSLILARALGFTFARSLRSSIKRMACALRTPVWVSARVRICTPTTPNKPSAMTTIAIKDSIRLNPF